MEQPTAAAKRDAMKIVFGLEHRCQQIDEAIAELKHSLGDLAESTSGEAMTVVHGLRWHLTNSMRHLESLEKTLGVEQTDPSRRPAISTAQRAASTLRGSTRDLSVPDLIGLLSAQEKTGTLWIKSLEENFILEFLHGAVVHAMSDTPRPEQRLGTILIARNKISAHKLDEFVAQHSSQDGKIGEAMAEANLVSEDDLRDALSWQVRELFQRVFSVDYAMFSFREGEISKVELRVSLNATQLLMEAAEAQSPESNDGDVAPPNEAEPANSVTSGGD